MSATAVVNPGTSKHQGNKKDNQKKLPPLEKSIATTVVKESHGESTNSAENKKAKAKVANGSNSSTKASKDGIVLNKVVIRKKSLTPTEVSLPKQVEDLNMMQKTFSVLEAAKLRLSLPPFEDAPDSCGKVRVRFNHYNKYFFIHNGVLKWQDVDDEYCLSFVYKGKYERRLVLKTGNETQKDIEEETGKKLAKHDHDYLYFVDLHNNDEYALEVIEDPECGIGAEGLRLNDKPLNAAALKNLSSESSRNKGGEEAVHQPNRAVNDITQQLKALNPADLGGEKARELLEQRDIEDVLFSS